MNTVKAKVLLAEDDLALAFMVKNCLEAEGYEVIHCIDGQQAIDRFDKNTINICLLDIMMPVKDGYAVAKKIRQQTDVLPILFLSTKKEEADKIKGYQTGADDYISKPFSLAELLMKMDVFLRRTKKMHSDDTLEYQLGQLQFSYSELKISSPGNAISITQREADLLKFFCDHAGKILKRDEILIHVWGKDDFFLGRSMDVFITKLRKYLKADTSVLLETIHGIGYRLVMPGLKTN